MKNSRFNWPLGLQFALLITLFLFSLMLFFLHPSVQRHGRVWQGYYLLLVDRDVQCEQIVARLANAGFEHVVAECTVTVSLNAFDSLESVPLSRIAVRLDPVDPRFDPYMRDLPAWFRATLGDDSMSIIYLATEDNPRTAYRRTAAALSGSDVRWVFPEWERRGAWVFGIAFLLLPTITVLRLKGLRVAAVAAALPWVGWVLHGGLPAFGAAVVVYGAVVLFMHRARHALREGRGERLLRDGFVLLAVVLTVVVSVPHGGYLSRLPVVAAATGSLAVLLLLVLLRRERYRNTDHALFTPLPLLSRRHAASAPGDVALLAPALILAILAPLVYVAVPSSATAPEIPEPEPLVGTLHSFETLQQLSNSTGPGNPPNLADYVAHRAFQEAFMYRAEWAVPRGGERVVRQRVAQNGGQLERTNETIVEYTPEWLDRVLQQSAVSGVEAIQLAQPYPTRVVLRRKSRLYFQRSFLARYAILVAVIAAPLVVSTAKRVVPRQRRVGLGYRSNRQLACFRY